MKKVVTSTILLTVLLTLPFLALAQAAPTVAFDINTLVGWLDTFVDWIFSILLILAVIILLYGAFLFLTAGGDEAKTGAARGYLMWAVVGLAVAILARGIVLFVCNFFGVACG